MIVTDLEYGLENKLIQKLDAMIQRCTQDNPKKDALLINEGAEGEGKSSSSWAEAYYVKYKTNREAHIFFRLEPMIEFAKANKDKIIIWDEPSLDALSTDALTKLSKNMTRLLMTVRKNRHFFIFNLTKFWKFPEYLVVDRCLGLVHMYSRKETIPGRFVYIKKKKLEALWKDYFSGKKRTYRQHKAFFGSFPMMEDKFDKMDFFVSGKPHATLEDYEREKDIAINSIGEKADNKDKEALNQLKMMLGSLTFPINNRTELARQLEVSETSLRRWNDKVNQKIKKSAENPNNEQVKSSISPPYLNINGVSGKKIILEPAWE